MLVVDANVNEAVEQIRGAGMVPSVTGLLRVIHDNAPKRMDEIVNELKVIAAKQCQLEKERDALNEMMSVVKKYL